MDDVQQTGFNTITALVKLAYDFGPFLFAVLFLLVVTRSAHRYSYQVHARITPPVTPPESAMYRLYFLSSFWFGIVLVTASVVWWIYAGMVTHVVEVVLRGAPAGLQIASDDAYQKVSYREIPGGNTYESDYYFAVVKNGSFRDGEPILFKYWRSDNISGGEGVAKVQLLPIEYDGDPHPIYEIVYNPDQPLTLKKR
jgi:hypothetical protein